MGWGDLVATERNKAERGKRPAEVGALRNKALDKIGSRGADSSDCLIVKQAVVLDMGEASREQGFRLNGCR